MGTAKMLDRIRSLFRRGEAVNRKKKRQLRLMQLEERRVLNATFAFDGTDQLILNSFDNVGGGGTGSTDLDVSFDNGANELVFTLNDGVWADAGVADPGISPSARRPLGGDRVGAVGMVRRVVGGRRDSHRRVGDALHRLAGVLQDVQEHLVEGALVAHDGREVVGDLGDELGARRDQPAQGLKKTRLIDAPRIIGRIARAFKEDRQCPGSPKTPVPQPSKPAMSLT